MRIIKNILFTAFFLSTFYGSFGQAPDITLESPYNTMFVHLYYLQPDSYDPDKAALTIYGTEDSLQAVKLAIKLKQIFDGKGLYVYLNKIPNDKNYKDSLVHKNIFTPFPKRLPAVYLEKNGDKWYYSAETARIIPELHKKVYPFGSDFLINILPQSGQRKFLGLALWQYLGILILLIVFAVFYSLLSYILKPIVRKISNSFIKATLVSPKLIWSISRIISFIILIWLMKIFLPVLQLPVEIGKFSIITISIIMTVLIILLILKIWDIVIIYATNYSKKTNIKTDEQLMPILKRIVQIIVIIGGIIQILRLLDVNITALIAGVSIGGLALALAAQDTVKNLIGSAMIFFDTPFQIGDFVEADGVSGTIIEVGFRSTRIQLADSSIVSIPNGNIANFSVKNMGVRVFRLMNTQIGITYDTPLYLIKKFISGLKEIIEIHPKAIIENSFVHMSEMADSSLNILFRVPLDVQDYGTELQVKEEILFAIMELAQSLGIQFAFPSSSLYVETFPEKASNLPTYNRDEEVLDKRVEEWRMKLEKLHKK